MRQCDLVGLAKSSYYYQPRGESADNLLYMRLIDEQYTQTPFYGSPKMTAWLQSQGYRVNQKRVCRLMRKMGLSAVVPKKRTSQPGKVSLKYPYLLKHLEVKRPNQVWSTDLTYIRLNGGYVYLCAIIDWFSRYVVAWEVSNSQDVLFCLTTLDKALSIGKPEIFNSDQGSQFTSQVFTDRLLSADIAISWDGRGRVFDNIFIERLWRSVKYENVYLNEYQTPSEVLDGLDEYFDFYNNQRLHQSLSYQTPAQVHFARN